MTDADTAPTLRVLVALISCPSLGFAEDVIQKLERLNHISLRTILDQNIQQDVGKVEEQRLWTNHDLTKPSLSLHARIGHVQRQAAELCQWADLLVLAPLDADILSKMLQGQADTLLLELLRGWDVSKKILLVPGMSVRQWENPMTKKQLSKLRRKWNWVRALPPLLWTFEQSGIRIVADDGASELINVVRNQIDLMNIGQDVEYPVSRSIPNHTKSIRSLSSASLPPELWTIILDFNGDWELAQALRIYTNLPKPREWQRSPGPETWMFSKELEWAILTGTLNDVKRLLQRDPPPRWLSRLSVKLIFKFAKTQVLSYLESHHKDLFWQTFGHTFLPDKASALFGKVEILEWWRTSPSFLTKEYTTEAIDGASRAGFVHVLNWWRRSGLPLRYTEAAMEQASARGNLEVLEWWREASVDKRDYQNDPTSQITTVPLNGPHDDAMIPLRLLPGKSISLAAQHNQAHVLRWWHESEIPVSHLDSVCRLASAAGHVEILSTFYSLLGDKMPYDNQVLIAASKHGHVNVLEWWKAMAKGVNGKGGNGGLRVEYKTCDVEEALEDCVDSGREESVRRWWAGNGLNLGVETSEWMKTKVL